VYFIKFVLTRKERVSPYVGRVVIWESQTDTSKDWLLSCWLKLMIDSSIKDFSTLKLIRSYKSYKLCKYNSK